MSADPSTWGVQPAGFVVPNTDEIITALNSGMLAYVSSDFDTDPDSPDGQVIGVFARQLALVWEALGRLHDSNNPDNAEGELLVEVSKLSGTVKQGPQPTTVQALCQLSSGTTLEAGVAMASVFNHPELLFTPAQTYTATADGYVTLDFVCTDTGPTPVPVHTLTVITTPITGWLSVTNAAAGVLGNNGDTDTILRARRDAELSATGSTTGPAIRADVLAIGPDVISCEVLVNTTNATNTDGVPAHSFEVVVYHDGTLDLTSLARTIWNNQAAGIMSSGSTHITFVDETGATRDVYYSPVTQVPITLVYALTTTTGYVGSTQFKADIAAAMTLRMTPGADVIALQAEALALAEGGVTDVTSFTVNGGTSNITITPRQIATFDPTRITVTP